MAKPSTGGIAKLIPVESTNLHQQVYRQLREAIMSGQFAPGETLTLRSLAAALGTSIMPARDAVLRLVAEHALETHGRSVRIPMLSLDQFRDIERFRIALEGEAAALAAVRATPAEIEAADQANTRMLKACEAGRAERFLAANQQFHFSVYRGAHNDLLYSMIETLWLQIGPHLAYMLNFMTDVAMHSIDMGPHGRLIEALRQRDAEGARTALAADLKDSTDVYKPYADLDRPDSLPTTIRRRQPGGARPGQA